jgi:hypothetical protein
MTGQPHPNRQTTLNTASACSAYFLTGDRLPTSGRRTGTRSGRRRGGRLSVHRQLDCPAHQSFQIRDHRRQRSGRRPVQQHSADRVAGVAVDFVVAALVGALHERGDLLTGGADFGVGAQHFRGLSGDRGLRQARQADGPAAADAEHVLGLPELPPHLYSPARLITARDQAQEALDVPTGLPILQKAALDEYVIGFDQLIAELQTEQAAAV